MLASQRACMRPVVRRLATCGSNSLLTPRPVGSIRLNPQIKKPPQGWLFYLVELGGIEPPSANPLQTVLHT